MVNLIRFIAALLKHWTGFITGSFLVAVLFAVEHYNGQSVSWDYAAAILILGFFVSSFKAWNELLLQRDELQTQNEILKTQMAEKPLTDIEKREATSAFCRRINQMLHVWRVNKPPPTLEEAQELIDAVKQFAKKHYPIQEYDRLNSYQVSEKELRLIELPSFFKGVPERDAARELHKLSWGLELLGTRISGGDSNYSAVLI